MNKSEALKLWASLPESLPILPHFAPIPYKAEGSKYGACGIRIDGTPEFVNAVLSRLKDLLDGENSVTRLGLARNPVDGTKLGKSFNNAEQRAEVCYIRLHMRGGDAAAMNSMFDRKLAEASNRFLEKCGK